MLYTLVVNNTELLSNSISTGIVTIVTEVRMERARLAQSVEHEILNLRVVGSSSTLGADRLAWLTNSPITSTFECVRLCSKAKLNTRVRQSHRLWNKTDKT